MTIGSLDGETFRWREIRQEEEEEEEEEEGECLARDPPNATPTWQHSLTFSKECLPDGVTFKLPSLRGNIAGSPDGETSGVDVAPSGRWVQKNVSPSGLWKRSCHPDGETFADVSPSGPRGSTRRGNIAPAGKHKAQMFPRRGGV